MSDTKTVLHMPEQKPAAPEQPMQLQPEQLPDRPVDDFKPQPVIIKLGEPGKEEEYELVFDLNAFCEMETMYESVDSVIQMLMGAPAPDLNKVTYNGAKVLAEDIMVDGKPLADYINQLANRSKAKYKDTLNLLWLGVLHNHTVYDEDGEVKKYTITKTKLGSMVTLANIREVNAKIMTAILRDLLPALVRSNQAKNEEQGASEEQ